MDEPKQIQIYLCEDSKKTRVIIGGVDLSPHLMALSIRVDTDDATSIAPEIELRFTTHRLPLEVTVEAETGRVAEVIQESVFNELRRVLKEN